MRIDRRDRAKGKTTDLIMLSNATNQNILVADTVKRAMIQRIAKDLNVDIPRVITVNELGEPAIMRYVKSILIDDVEAVLKEWTTKEIDVVTTSCKIAESVDNGYIPKIAKEISELVARKNKDYDNSFDKSIDRRGSDVYFIRIEDKLSRLEHLLKSKETAQVNESIEDTLKDVIGYTLLMMNYLNNRKGATKGLKYASYQM